MQLTVGRLCRMVSGPGPSSQGPTRPDVDSLARNPYLHRIFVPRLETSLNREREERPISRCFHELNIQTALTVQLKAGSHSRQFQSANVRPRDARNGQKIRHRYNNLCSSLKERFSIYAIVASGSTFFFFFFFFGLPSFYLRCAPTYIYSVRSALSFLLERLTLSIRSTLDTSRPRRRTTKLCWPNGRIEMAIRQWRVG